MSSYDPYLRDRLYDKINPEQSTFYDKKVAEIAKADALDFWHIYGASLRRARHGSVDDSDKATLRH